jgi:hypothetical protein
MGRHSRNVRQKIYRQREKQRDEKALKNVPKK